MPDTTMPDDAICTCDNCGCLSYLPPDAPPTPAQFVLTPAGMQTPEGLRKVNASMLAVEEANAACARLLQSLVSTTSADHLAKQLHAGGMGINRGHPLDAALIILDALNKRQVAIDTFVNALSGR